MGTPSKAAFFAELTRYGVPIVDMTAGSRNLGSFEALAVTVHDSVTGAMSDQGAANFCKEGRSDVRGPLYGSLLGKDGRLYVLTLGRSNNTGSCSGARSAAARGGVMPLDAELGTPGGDDYSSANSTHYGIAYVTYGAGPYTAVQRERMPLVLAAYIRAAGWSPEGGARSLIGHGEVTRRKSDPLLDMGEIRRAARAAAASPPVDEPEPVPVVPVPPTSEEDDDMTAQTTCCPDKDAALATEGCDRLVLAAAVPVSAVITAWEGPPPGKPYKPKSWENSYGPDNKLGVSTVAGSALRPDTRRVTVTGLSGGCLHVRAFKS